MQLITTDVENGTRIEVIGDRKAAIVVRDNGEERILLPLKDQYSESTYYYENASGLTETERGYVGFYPGSPDTIELIN